MRRLQYLLRRIQWKLPARMDREAFYHWIGVSQHGWSEIDFGDEPPWFVERWVELGIIELVENTASIYKVKWRLRSIEDLMSDADARNRRDGR